MLCRSAEDVEDVKREVQIMHHLAGHPNVTLLKGAYEDRHHVHLVRARPEFASLTAKQMQHWPFVQALPMFADDCTA